MESELTWEIEARAAMEAAMRVAEWDYAHKQVTIQLENVRDGEVSVEAHSKAQLVGCLEDEAENAWYASVPFDGGAAVFDFDPAWVAEYLEDNFNEELRKMGWL